MSNNMQNRNMQNMTASQILAQQSLYQQNAYQAGVGAQNTVMAPETVAEYAARMKREAFASAEVLEYLEAQLRMDLWKNERDHYIIFQNAMRAAINTIMGRKVDE